MNTNDCSHVYTLANWRQQRLYTCRKLVRADRRAEPLVGERVPYVVVYGLPGQPLIQLVRQPLDMLQDPNLRINATYYVTKAILPPLERVLSLLGVNVFTWYNNLPRRQKVGPQVQQPEQNKKVSAFCDCILLYLGPIQSTPMGQIIASKCITIT